MSEDEYRTHFSLWAILTAPLIAGNDLSKMTPYTLEMLTNREIIAIDHDPLGKQGYRVAQEGPFEVWMKPMSDGSKVVGLFNRQRTTEKITVNFSQIGVQGEAAVRDLWLKKDMGIYEDSFSANVPRHCVVLVRIRKK
jgi:alpha-galactosidase